STIIPTPKPAPALTRAITLVHVSKYLIIGCPAHRNVIGPPLACVLNAHLFREGEHRSEAQNPVSGADGPALPAGHCDLAGQDGPQDNCQKNRDNEENAAARPQDGEVYEEGRRGQDDRQEGSGSRS